MYIIAYTLKEIKDIFDFPISFYPMYRRKAAALLSCEVGRFYDTIQIVGVDIFP